MEIRRLPADKEVLRRYAAELWLPYHRDLEANVAAHALADQPDEKLVAAETRFRLNLLREDGDRRLWVVAVDAGVGAGDIDPASPDPTDPTPAGVSDPDRDLVAFVSTSVDESPTVFDRPDRLVVDDIYVSEPYRGIGIADRLMERAVIDAREADCGELRLDVDVDNERATAFYEKYEFELHRKRLTRDVE